MSQENSKETPINPSQPVNPNLSPFRQFRLLQLTNEVEITLSESKTKHSRKPNNKYYYSDPYIIYALIRRGVISLSLAAVDRIERDKKLDLLAEEVPEAANIRSAAKHEINLLRRRLQSRLKANYDGKEILARLHCIGKEEFELKFPKTTNNPK